MLVILWPPILQQMCHIGHPYGHCFNSQKYYVSHFIVTFFTANVVSWLFLCDCFYGLFITLDIFMVSLLMASTHPPFS